MQDLCDFTDDLSAFQPTESELIDYCRGSAYTNRVTFSKKGDETEDVLPPAPLEFFAYPNPVNEQLLLSGLEPIAVQVAIYDLAGKCQYSGIGTPNSAGIMAMETSFLLPGTYILTASSNGRQKSIKFVKVP